MYIYILVKSAVTTEARYVEMIFTLSHTHIIFFYFYKSFGSFELSFR